MKLFSKTSHRCTSRRNWRHVLIWSKKDTFSVYFDQVKHNFTENGQKKTYLRIKQCKRNIQVMLQEIVFWNLSEAWRRNRITTTTRTAILLILIIHQNRLKLCIFFSLVQQNALTSTNDLLANRNNIVGVFKSEV